MRSAPDMLYPGSAGAIRLRNQIRVCACDSGIRLGRGRGSRVRGPSAVTVVARVARSARSRLSNTSVSAIDNPWSMRARATMRAAVSESAPSENRLSETLTRSHPSASARSPASTFSAGVLGARNSCGSPERSGAGRAEASSLPERVVGKESTKTTPTGTM